MRERERERERKSSTVRYMIHDGVSIQANSYLIIRQKRYQIMETTRRFDDNSGSATNYECLTKVVTSGGLLGPVSECLRAGKENSAERRG